ncbi:hypothetical protein AB0J90_26730 [Micromonospora sp. NPDC049523]|uniref:hypothetical protein n=1 Tax=Micromonospora sp. NPDC049523 TaxID=3155921 RepID=UPI0034330777
MFPHARLLRRLSTAGLATGVALVLVAVGVPSPAHAVGAVGPNGEICSPANHGAAAYEIKSVEVNPTLTHFISINIAPGTTGERTETLQRMHTVSTSIGASTEITSEMSAFFAKVAIKVGFSVQTETSTTDTETTTMRWNFNEPGYYGLYKGTRAVSGSFRGYFCQAPTSNSRPFWRAGFETTSYTTFSNFESGTVTCGIDVPVDSLRFKARLQLGC